MLQSYFWIIAFQECAFIERQKGIFVEKKNAAKFFFCSQSVFVLLWIERRMERMRWMMFLLSIITYLLDDEKKKVEKNTLLKILSRVWNVISYVLNQYLKVKIVNWAFVNIKKKKIWKRNCLWNNILTFEMNEYIEQTLLN